MTSRPVRLAALGLLSLACAAACGGPPDVTLATPGPCAQTSVQTTAGRQRTAVAGPGLEAVLGYPGELRAGAPAPMSWLVDGRRAGGDLRLLAQRLENTADLVRAGPFPATGASSGIEHFESTIRLPRAGCWDIQASSGTARGDLILKVA